MYETFAREVSLPMFLAQQGYLGCVMSRDDSQAMVLTFWRDKTAIDALESSSSYQATVARILAAGLLEEPQSTEVTEVHLLNLARLSDSVSFDGSIQS